MNYNKSIDEELAIKLVDITKVIAFCYGALEDLECNNLKKDKNYGMFLALLRRKIHEENKIYNSIDSPEKLYALKKLLKEERNIYKTDTVIDEEVYKRINARLEILQSLILEGNIIDVNKEEFFVLLESGIVNSISEAQDFLYCKECLRIVYADQFFLSSLCKLQESIDSKKFRDEVIKYKYRIAYISADVENILGSKNFEITKIDDLDEEYLAKMINVDKNYYRNVSRSLIMEMLALPIGVLSDLEDKNFLDENTAIQARFQVCFLQAGLNFLGYEEQLGVQQFFKEELFDKCNNKIGISLIMSVFEEEQKRKKTKK